MTDRSATDYLIRTVLDDAFRGQALTDPAGAMGGYDLSEEEMDILQSRDDRLLALLGAAVSEETVPGDPRVVPEITGADTKAHPTLPVVELLMKLTPQTAVAADGTSQVSYGVSLESFPAADAGASEPQSGEVSGVSWLIRLAPTVVTADPKGMRVAYAATIHSFNPADSPGPPAEGVDSPALRSPWRHDLESNRARAAARSVLECSTDERYEELLSLIEVMQAGEDRA